MYTYDTAPKKLRQQLLDRCRTGAEDNSASDEEARTYWMEFSNFEGTPAYFDEDGNEYKVLLEI